MDQGGILPLFVSCLFENVIVKNMAIKALQRMKWKPV